MTFGTFNCDKIDFEERKNIVFAKKNFLKTDKKPTKKRQKPIKTDKNRFYFFGLRPDRQKPTMKMDVDLQAS